MGQMKLVSSLLTVVLITAELAGAGVASGQTRDYGALTCGNFLASGHDNMAVIIWWLRGHHAGKTGVNSFDPKDDCYVPAMAAGRGGCAPAGGR
jgi:hypothetical protein